jgi:hypothetical protein
LGALLEVLGTNIATYSEDFSNSVWYKNNCLNAVDAVVAPDGTTTADRVYYSFNAIGGIQRTFAATAGQLNSFSVFVKKNTERWFRIRISQDASIRYDAWFDLDNGVPGSATAGISRVRMEPVGNDWYRCHVSCTSTITSVYIEFGPCNGDGELTGYTGDSTYIWGAQFENNRYFCSSYVKTEASSVTRSRDDLIFLNSEYGNWMGNMSEGTVLIHLTRDNHFSNTGYGLAFTDNTPDVNNLIQTPFIYSGGLGVIRVNVGGTGQFSDNNLLFPNSPAVDYGPRKLAFAFKQDDMARAHNGGSLLTDTAGSLPTALDRFVVSFNQAFIGHVKQFMFWPTRLDNQTIQDLTLR